MKNLRRALRPLADFLMLPFVYAAALLLRRIRDFGIFKFPHCKAAMLRVGVFPVRNHYYEPQFDYRALKYSLSQERLLPGIDWNVDGQLKLLDTLSFSQELASIPREKPDALEFYIGNVLFAAGDAEYWYQLIRAIKPRRIFEVGSGNSTLMAIKATRKNQEDDPDYRCKHVCIEPYEMPWLEQIGVSVMREKIEDVPIAFFADLQGDDILFIDSSHIIRPQGDVLFEYLQLLPTLNTGVIVHVHDIFSPRNYPKKWLADEVKFWNEQYLLEAFLTHNQGWKIIGALNYLRHHHYDRLRSVAPFLSPDREPASFYIQKVA